MGDDIEKWLLDSKTEIAEEVSQVLEGKTPHPFKRCCDNPPVYYWKKSEIYIKLSNDLVIWAYNKFGDAMVTIVREGDRLYRRQPTDEERELFFSVTSLIIDYEEGC